MVEDENTNYGSRFELEASFTFLISKVIPFSELFCNLLRVPDLDNQFSETEFANLNRQPNHNQENSVLTK